MAEISGTNGFKVWIARVADVIEVTGKISGGSLAIILLGLVISTYFGWIHSPFAALPETLKQHDDRVTRVIDTRTQTERNLLLVLQALQGEVQKIHRVQQIRTCSEIANTSLREMCLR